MKIFIMKKRTFAILVGVIAVALVAVLCTGNLGIASVYLNMVEKETPIYCVDTDENVVAVTFDAAWGSDKTLDIINMCIEYEVNATFFLVGFWVEENLEVAKAIVENGFEIGLHSNTHPDMTTLTVAQMQLEVEQNQAIIEENLGVTAKYFRCPYGSYNDDVINTIRDMGLEVVQWDVDTHDWMGISAADIAGRVSSLSKNGSIILMHNNSDNVVQAIKLMFETFALQGTECVTMSELVYDDNYTIDWVTGIQSKI